MGVDSVKHPITRRQHIGIVAQRQMIIAIGRDGKWHCKKTQVTVQVMSRAGHFDQRKFLHIGAGFNGDAAPNRRHIGRAGNAGAGAGRTVGVK